MPDRDWSKELAKIDRQLQSLPDDALAPSKPTSSAAGALSAGGSAGSKGASAPAAPRGRAATFGVFGRLGLSAALGVGMFFWPYEARCGGGLALYLGAVAVLIVSGTWSTVWSWRHRAGRAQSLSLLLLLWGLVLGSLEVLPRIGYAIPTAAHPATWACK